MLQKYNINYQKYISYILIAYTFSFPLSKATTNLFEIIAILLWIFEGNWKEKLQLYTHNLLSLTLLTLIGYSLLSILWHGHIDTTLHYIFKYKHLFIIFVFYSSFDTKYTRHIISAFIMAMFISELASYGIFFELIHYKNIPSTDPSPFMSHMTYSTILAFAISILIVKLIYEKHLHYKLFYILFTLSATINLFINGGRTGQVIYILLIGFILFSVIQSKIKAFLGTSIIILLTFFLAYSFSTNFHARANQLTQDINNTLFHHNYAGSGGTRFALSVVGIDTFLQKPLLGTGISYTMKNLQENATQNGFNAKELSNYSDYHNAFLTISTQLGIVGLVISFAIIFSLFSFNIKHKEYKMFSLLFALSFVVFSFTHNTLHTMNPMIFFTLFAGLFNKISRTHSLHQ